jgi:hypothetical protein
VNIEFHHTFVAHFKKEGLADDPNSEHSSHTVLGATGDHQLGETGSLKVFEIMLK